MFSLLVVLVGLSDSRHTSNEYGKPFPNVLVFITDDLGYSDLSCFGNEMIKTPNIDKLAESGLQLKRMYATPSDAGSMAAVLTGRYCQMNREENYMINSTFKYKFETL